MANLAEGISLSAKPKMYENLFEREKVSRAQDEKLRRANDSKVFGEFKNYLNIPKDTYHRAIIPEVQKMYEDTWNKIKQSYQDNPNGYHVTALDDLNSLKEGLMPLRDLSKNLFETEKELTDLKKNGQTTSQHDQLLNVLKTGNMQDFQNLKSDPLGDYSITPQGISLSNFGSKDKNYTQQWQSILKSQLEDTPGDPATEKTRQFGIGRQETTRMKSLNPDMVHQNAASFMASNPGLVQDVINQNREDILAGKYSPGGKFDPNDQSYKGKVVQDWFEKASAGHTSKEEKVTGAAVPKQSEADKTKKSFGWHDDGFQNQRFNAKKQGTGEYVGHYLDASEDHVKQHWASSQALEMNGKKIPDFTEVEGAFVGTKVMVNPDTGKKQVYAKIVQPGVTETDKTGETEGLAHKKYTGTTTPVKLAPRTYLLPYGELADDIETRTNDKKGTGGFRIPKSELDNINTPVSKKDKMKSIFQ